MKLEKWLGFVYFSMFTSLDLNHVSESRFNCASIPDLSRNGNNLAVDSEAILLVCRLLVICCLTRIRQDSGKQLIVNEATTSPD